MDNENFALECDKALRQLKNMALLNARAIAAVEKAKNEISVENKFAIFIEFVAMNAAFLDFLENQSISLHSMKGALRRVQNMSANFFGADLCTAAIKSGYPRGQ